MHYLLFYEVSADYVSRRAEFRDAHLEKAWAASARGDLMLGGALANPVDGAILLFKGDSPEVAEQFAKTDPYVTSGAVKRWYVREWNTVVGEDAATPIRSDTLSADKKTSRGQSKEMGSGPSSSTGMILRTWRASATAEKSVEYVEHAINKVFPTLRAIAGHRGAYLLRRAVDGAVDLGVLTLWESMDAVRKFAGDEPEYAVVEPEARAILTSFDDCATHFEIIHREGEAIG